MSAAVCSGSTKRRGFCYRPGAFSRRHTTPGLFTSAPGAASPTDPRPLQCSALSQPLCVQGGSGLSLVPRPIVPPLLREGSVNQHSPVHIRIQCGRDPTPCEATARLLSEGSGCYKKKKKRFISASERGNTRERKWARKTRPVR